VGLHHHSPAHPAPQRTPLRLLLLPLLTAGLLLLLLSLLPRLPLLAAAAVLYLTVAVPQPWTALLPSCHSLLLHLPAKLTWAEHHLSSGTGCCAHLLLLLHLPSAVVSA